MNKRKCRNDCEALIERRHSCDDGTSRSSWSVTANGNRFAWSTSLSSARRILKLFHLEYSRENNERGRIEEKSGKKSDELSMKIDMIVKKEFQSARQSRGRLLYTSPIRVQIFLTKKKINK